MTTAAQEKDYDRLRNQMVDFLRSHYKIRNESVLDAMATVRRHLFVPEKERAGYNPYGDYPCPIGHGQTISQPYIVAYMTELLDLHKGDKVLEIGSGSGYQSAVLAATGLEVFSIEIIPDLSIHAGRILSSEGYSKVHILNGDGYNGWREYAPYEGIIVTCSPESVPDQLVKQLNEGGRLVIPVGRAVQTLVLLEKKAGKIIEKHDIAVRFVPMVSGDTGI